MKCFRIVLVTTLLLLLLTGCSDGVYSGTVVFDGLHQFDSSTYLPGDVILRAGEAQFAPGSRVAGTVYMLGGTLKTDGAIDGDVAMLDGTLVLGPNAVVGGDLRVGGGELQRAPGATVKGEIVANLNLPELEAAEAEGRTWDDYVRALAGVLLLALLGYAFVRRYARPVEIVAQAAFGYPLVAVALGLLTAIVVPALLVVMAFTIVLLPLVAVLAVVLLLLAGYGYVVVGVRLGRWLADRLSLALSDAAAAFWGTLLLLATAQIPVAGSVLLTLVAIWALGAIFLTRLGLRPYTPPRYLQTLDDPESYARPTDLTT